MNESLCVCVCVWERVGWGGLQVAAKLFISRSKLFKARQICFSGGTQRVGEEGGSGYGGG